MLYIADHLHHHHFEKGWREGKGGFLCGMINYVWECEFVTLCTFCLGDLCINFFIRNRETHALYTHTDTHTLKCQLGGVIDPRVVQAAVAGSQFRSSSMAGVWVFKDGVTRLVQNPLAESQDATNQRVSGSLRRKVLVYVATDETITCYNDLEEKLLELGWKPYRGGGGLDAGGQQLLRQYHKSSSTLDLISLPHDFANFKTMHMYDIVVKNRNAFEVRDAAA